MIHLKIIGAYLPDTGKAHNAYFKIIPKHENNSFSPIAIYKSKKAKKTNNPEWNQEFCIPFYCFDSVIVEFWNKKVIGEKYLGKGEIKFIPEEFKQSSVQTMHINLEENPNHFQSYCTYKILPTFSSLDVKSTTQLGFNVYIYLTYDPPLQPNQDQKVELLTQKIDGNGTVFEKAYKKENIRNATGPSGPTTIYKYDVFFSNDICFFYVKSTNYTGQVTLNIANMPYPAQIPEIDEYFLLYKGISVPVESQKDVNFSYSIFPYQFKISNRQLNLNQFSQFSQTINPQKFPFNSQPLIEKTNDPFLNLFEYFHSNPEGIALKNIFDVGSRGICTSGMAYHRRFEIEHSKLYSIKSAFKFHEIQWEPINLVVAMDDTNCPNYKFFVFTSGENAQNLTDSTESGVVSKISPRGVGFVNDVPKFCFSLDRVQKSDKYVALLFSSDSSHVMDNVQYRLVEERSKKELMFLKTKNDSKKSSVLVALFVRDGDDWEFSPCMQFFSGDGSENAYEFMHDFLIDGFDKLYK